MKQIISLGIGQAGIQASNSCWQLFCHQHSLNLEGRLTYPSYADNYYDINTFFVQTKSGKNIPRALMLDLETTTIDQITSGPFRDLYQPHSLFSGKDGSCHNFARATSSIGHNFIELAMDKIRKIADNCNDFQGFLMTSSVGGGCGSGLGSLLLQRLSEEYDKKVRISFPIYPSEQTSISTVEPYNTVLGSCSLLQSSDMCLMMDNRAIYRICSNLLDVYRPAYINLNRVIARVYSSVTSSFRFESAANNNKNMREMVANMVPFQAFNFLVTAYSPLISADRMCFSGVSVDELTGNMFEDSGLMVKCNLKYGKYMACSLMYMGDVVPRDINNTIRQRRQNKSIQFVDWCPNGYRVSLNYKMPTCFPGQDLIRSFRAGGMMANTTAISNVFSNYAYNFDRMYAKKAFVHWYLQEGMEEQKFSEARESLAVLEKDYEEAEKDTEDSEEESDKKQNENG